MVVAKILVAKDQNSCSDVGVVDSKYIVHKGIQTLGGSELLAKKVMLFLFSHFLVASSLLLKHKNYSISVSKKERQQLVFKFTNWFVKFFHSMGWHMTIAKFDGFVKYIYLLKYIFIGSNMIEEKE